MGHKTPILGVFYTLGCAWAHPAQPMSTPVVTESMGGRQWLAQRPKNKKMVAVTITVGHTVTCLQSPIHSYTPQSLRHHPRSLQWTGTQWHRKVIWRHSGTYIYSKILILQKKNAHSVVLLSRGILLTISAKVEATVPAQLTFHCSLFSSYSMDFRQHRGGDSNNDSRHLSLPFIFVTFYGLSSKQRWRLQYRLYTPFTVVYFHHILWIFANAKVEATIPTQHIFHCSLFSSHSMAFGNAKVEATVPTQLTFHCRLFSSHSMDFRQDKDVGYNTQHAFHCPSHSMDFRNTEVEATIPTQHTFYCPLVSSHSRDFRQLLPTATANTHIVTTARIGGFFTGRTEVSAFMYLLYKRHKGLKHHRKSRKMRFGTQVYFNIHFTAPNQQNSKICSSESILQYHTEYCYMFRSAKGPSSGNQTKVISHKTKSLTFEHRWRGVKKWNRNNVDICL